MPGGVYTGATRQRVITRLVVLIRLAESRHRMPSLADLAREHGCSERTIRRDLEIIELSMPVQWRQKDAA